MIFPAMERCCLDHLQTASLYILTLHGRQERKRREGEDRWNDART